MVVKYKALNSTEYEANRNYRANVRDKIVSFVNDLSVFDMDSIKAQGSLLASLTTQTDEITRKSGVSLKINIKNTNLFMV
jgi:hypothetical protein